MGGFSPITGAPHPGGHSFHTALIPKLQKMGVTDGRAVSRSECERLRWHLCVEDNIKGGCADSSLMAGTRHWRGTGSIPSQGN